MYAVAALVIVFGRAESNSVAPVAKLPYGLANYASSYSANVVNHAVAAPCGSPANLPVTAYPRTAEQALAAQFASNPFAPAFRTAAPETLTAPAAYAPSSAATLGFPAAASVPAASAAPSLSSTAFAAGAPSPAAYAASAPASTAFTVPTAAFAPASTPAAGASIAAPAPAASTATLSNEFAAAPSASYAYQFRSASSFPGAPYNLPYSPYSYST